jgi:hypothetical protein
MERIKKQFSEMDLMPIFEIEVRDNKTNEIDYVIFNIEIVGDEFRAYHEPLTTEQKQSEKIAYESVEIDPYLSLDENLQELFAECNQAIYESEFFVLWE